jgi:cysteine desulfurase
MNEPMIYLDHAANTAIRAGVLDAMRPYLTVRYGNAASNHAAGRAARVALEESRERIATVLGSARSEIIFTGSGTEANNLAVLGRWRAAEGGVAVSAIEHSAVLAAAAQAGREGADVTVVGVDESGVVDLDAVAEVLVNPQAVLSIMWANNEMGALQPIQAVAELCRSRGVAFHTDAVQAAGHVPVSVADAGCDLLSISAHKLGGPQGVGALYVRDGTELAPLLFGGGQEAGLRAGTANVAGAVGLADALERATLAMPEETPRLAALRDVLEQVLLDAVPDLAVNGPQAPAARLPHILSVGVDGVDPDVLFPALDLAGVAVSSGSACHTGATEPSHVMLAMGAAHDATVRFSVGWNSREEEVRAAATAVADVITRLRASVGRP